jgi:hypothetical protein
MNVRVFVAHSPDGRADDDRWWFGGGMDLTPYYGFADDAVHFHRICREALAPFGADIHPRYKRWCDEYFYLKHRKEPRGIGGIFFDDLSEGGFDRCFALVRSVGDRFLDAYAPIVARRSENPVRRARARFPGVPARALRRVQPRVGSRDAVRIAIGRPHRGHPDVASACREVALRLEACTWHARSAALLRLSDCQGLAMSETGRASPSD